MARSMGRQRRRRLTLETFRPNSFGLAGEPHLRHALGIQDRQLDPKSPSNPSNQNYIMLFMAAPGGAARAGPPVLQFRGLPEVRAAAAFLAAALVGGRAGTLDVPQGGYMNSDGSDWNPDGSEACCVPDDVRVDSGTCLAWMWVLM